MFSPTLGRWATMDPIGFTGGTTNQYMGLDNNPISLLDPLGLATITVDMQSWFQRLLNEQVVDKFFDKFNVKDIHTFSDAGAFLVGLAAEGFNTPVKVQKFLPYFTCVTTSRRRRCISPRRTASSMRIRYRS